MINNEGKGQLLVGLQTKIALWPLLDLYGKVEEIAVIDDELAEKGAALFEDAKIDLDDNENDNADEKKNKNGGRALGYVVSFHSIHGKNVQMDSRRINAKRFDSFWNSLTFTQEPLKTYDITFLEVTKVERNYAGTAIKDY